MVIINTLSGGWTVDPPDIDLTLTYDPTSNGTTYQEENNFIFSPSDQSILTIGSNSTEVISIPVSLPANKGIKDLDFELTLDGANDGHLKYVTITVDIGNANNAQLIFRGDNVSGSGISFNANQGDMNLVRFDDEADKAYNQTLMFNQRVSGNNNLGNFDNQTLNEFRIYIYNSLSSGWTMNLDRSKVKVFIDPTD